MVITMKRERSEWSNYWWDHADTDGDRILLIGDSITNGYAAAVRKQLEGIAFVDLLANSKFIADEAMEREIAYFLSQYSYKAIHFNNGLHGIDLPNAAYQEGYERILRLLLSRGSALCLAASTPVTIPGRPKMLDSIINAVVLERNRITEQIAAANALPINDLYHAVVGKKNIRNKDGYHYKAKGYQLLGKQVADCIMRSLYPNRM